MNPHIARIQQEMTKHHTSHVLHLILSFLTGGVWIIIWILVADEDSATMRFLENELRLAAENENYVPSLKRSSKILRFFGKLLFMFIALCFIIIILGEIVGA